MTVQEIQALVRSLQDGISHAGYKFDAQKRAAKNAAEDRINLFFATMPEAKAIYEQKIQLAKAWSDLKAAEDAAALAKQGKWPVGTKLALWKRIPVGRYLRPGDKGYGAPDRYELTTERGVYEVVTSATVHAENMSSWSRAGVGAFIIRDLRKNGLPGKTYQSVSDLWAPVGVDLDAHFNAELRATEQAAKDAANAAKAKFAADAAEVFGL